MCKAFGESATAHIRRNLLRDILGYHIIVGKSLSAQDVAAQPSLTPLSDSGNMLFVDTSGTGVQLVGLGSNARWVADSRPTPSHAGGCMKPVVPCGLCAT